MREETIKLYQFDELSDEAKETALEKLQNINVDFDWWEFVYDDAEQIGIRIDEFDLDRGSCCKGYFYHSEETIAENIIKNHGESCETYKTAEEFLNACNGLDDESDEYEQICDEFRYNIFEDYRIILQKEYEYLTSEEAIIETIRCNEYEFTEDGGLY